MSQSKYNSLHKFCLEEQLRALDINKPSFLRTEEFKSFEECQTFAALSSQRHWKPLEESFPPSTTPLQISTMKKPFIECPINTDYLSTSPNSVMRELSPPSQGNSSHYYSASKSSNAFSFLDSNTSAHRTEKPHVATSTMPIPSPRLRDDIIYQVQFKYNFKHCTVHANAHLGPLQKGSFVMIECEHKGQDLGVITDVMSVGAFARRRAAVGMSKDSEENNIGTILRIATVTERQQLPTKREREESLLKTILYLVHKVYRLPMNVSGVDFQFDNRKVNIFFTAEVRVDIRELVKHLHTLLKMRIWMKKTNECSPFIPKKFATLALRTGHTPPPPTTTNIV